MSIRCADQFDFELLNCIGYLVHLKRVRFHELNLLWSLYVRHREFKVLPLHFLKGKITYISLRVVFFGINYMKFTNFFFISKIDVLCRDDHTYEKSNKIFNITNKPTFYQQQFSAIVWYIYQMFLNIQKTNVNIWIVRIFAAHRKIEPHFEHTKIPYVRKWRMHCGRFGNTAYKKINNSFDLVVCVFLVGWLAKYTLKCKIKYELVLISSQWMNDLRS